MNSDLLSNRKLDFCQLRNLALGCIVASAAAVSTGQTTGTANVVETAERSTYQTSDSQAAVTPASFDDAASTESRMHRLDVRLFSIIPTVGIASYRDTTGPGFMITGLGGMVGPAYTDEERSFGVQIRPQFIDGKFGTAVKLTPWPADAVIQDRSFQVDLSSLDAKTVELGHAPDGRVYKLSLVPSMEIKAPEVSVPIADAFKKVEQMTFENSVVILNYDSYVGTILGMGDTERAYVDIPGLLRVDFSLVQLVGYEKMGSLKGGRIDLRVSEENSLQIYNVLSGAGNIIADGPYEVWAKWTPAKETTAEVVRKTLAMYEKEKLSGNPVVDRPEMKAILERLKRGKPMMSYGSAGLSDSERVVKK